MDKITQFCEPIAQSIIDSLQAADDGSTWQMPWASMEMRPYNYYTKEPYHGVNILVFAAKAMSMGYTQPYWMTFNQMRSMSKARGINLSVKGEKATRYVKYTPATKRGYTMIDDRTAIAPDGEHVAASAARYLACSIFTGFNVEQMTGWPADEFPEFEPLTTQLNHQPCIDWWVATGSKLPPVEVGVLAAFKTVSDVVVMPPLERFESEPHYWATLLHEFAHSTGHDDRLGRVFASDKISYAKEELIAEFSAAYLTSYFGLPGDLRHREYISSWVQLLKSDPSVIWHTASHADKAATWLLEAGGLTWATPFETDQEQVA